MGYLKITLLIIFAIVQIIVLVLSISAIVLPEWLDPERSVILIDEERQYVDNVGLWQLCVGPLGTDDSRGNKFSQIGSDDCKNGYTVEDFYRGKPNAENSVFGEDVLSELMATRAMAILFVICAFVKFFMVLASKCREKGGQYSLMIAILIAILEAGSAAGALVAYGLILGKSVDQQNEIVMEDVNIRDLWGLSYELFLASASIAVVTDLALCICC